MVRKQEAIKPANCVDLAPGFAGESGGKLIIEHMVGCSRWDGHGSNLHNQLRTSVDLRHICSLPPLTTVTSLYKTCSDVGRPTLLYRLVVKIGI